MTNEPLLLQGCRRVADYAALACGFLILIASLLITLEIILRNLFGLSMNGADELSGYALAITSTWALSATLLARRHIRIDSLYIRLPRSVQLTLDVIGLCSMLVFFGFVLRYGWILTERSFRIGAKAMTPLATPLAIPQALWLVGLIVFVATCGLLLSLAISRLMRGQWAEARRLISNRDTQEDIQEELHEAVERAQGEKPLKELCHVS